MNYVEYGKENSDVIILLHAGGLSWWNYKEVAERLQTDYHVVLPILDGHAGCDKQFTTIENNALDIIEFVNSKLGGSVLMMGGLSLGGQILLEILSQRKDIYKYAIVESVLVIPSKFTYSMNHSIHMCYCKFNVLLLHTSFILCSYFAILPNFISNILHLYSGSYEL